MKPAWSDLPIAPLLPAIASALSGGGALVLQAETGAGKTTAIPAHLVSLPGTATPPDVSRRIIVLEPRRLAAIAAAHRVSALLGDQPGGLAGYRVRGAVRSGPRTRVEFVTQAVFLRMIQEDPFVQDTGLVVFDEFHERTITSDLALAFAREAREVRGDLSILVMSATMDTAKVAAFLGCPEMSAPGRAWPVEVQYQPPRPGESIEATVTRAVRAALEATPGDVLAFLPGMRELRRVADYLADYLTGHSAGRRSGGSANDRGRPDATELLLLHGSLALEEQKRVLSPEPHGGRRVVLATNVAETSLTVPGVAAVVDAGLSRFLGWHVRSGLNRLETGMVSVSEAEQRRGRAGRQGPGICIRCWDENLSLPVSRGPEISRSELAALVLECAARGICIPENLKWLDPPPSGAWEAGALLLADLGLVGRHSGAITAAGRKALSLGVDPRVGAALVAATMENQPSTLASIQSSTPTTVQAYKQAAVLACAVVGERDPDDFGGDGDFCSRLLRVLDGPGNERTWAILAEANRLADRLGLGRFEGALARRAVEQAGELLAPGFPDRLAKLLPDGTWEFSSGRRARAVAELPRSDWILALDVDAGDTLGMIRQGTAIGTGLALKVLTPNARQVTELEWKGLRVTVYERLKAGAFLITQRRLAAPDRESLAAAVRDRLAREGLAWLPWNEVSSAFLARVRYATRLGVPGLTGLSGLTGLTGMTDRAGISGPKGGPSVADSPGGMLWDDAALVIRLGEALVPYLNIHGPVLDEAAFSQALQAMLEPDAAKVLSRAAPAFVETPGGRRRRPLYPSTGPARLAMRIQEAFGLRQVPVVCGCPLVVELLSPADRPLQVTDDLASFWENTYPTLRAELKRRYPKHYWPEDPLNAEPTKGLKPRSGPGHPVS